MFQNKNQVFHWHILCRIKWLPLLGFLLSVRRTFTKNVLCTLLAFQFVISIWKKTPKTSKLTFVLCQWCYAMTVNLCGCWNMYTLKLYSPSRLLHVSYLFNSFRSYDSLNSENPLLLFFSNKINELIVFSLFYYTIWRYSVFLLIF